MKLVLCYWSARELYRVLRRFIPHHFFVSCQQALRPSLQGYTQYGPNQAMG
jgi:hypothetical protein